MKKIILLALILIGFIGHSRAQGQIASPSYEVQKIPASPDVAELGKFGDIPINKYNGTANVSIPIHQINFDGLSIPVSLNYNTSGIRVNQDASWVGLGWSLNEGFTITREVNGYDDINSSDTTQKSNGWIYTPDYLAPFSGPPSNYNLEMSAANLVTLDTQDTNNYPYDTQPDVFTVSLPSGSVRFNLPKIVGAETELIGISLNDTNYIIKYNIAARTFIVIDPNGFTYDFTETEHSTGYASWDADPTAANELEVLDGMPIGSTNQTKQMIKAWKVSKITSPMGKELNFTYQAGFFMSYPSYSETHVQGIFALTANEAPLEVQLSQYNPISAYINAFNNLYLTNISGDFGSLDFILGDRSDLFSKEAQVRLRDWLSGGSGASWNISITPNTYSAKRLDRIDLKDPNGNLIKDANFTYTYFNESKLNHTIKEKWLRLKLDEVTIQDQTYEFDYYYDEIGGIALPEKDTKSVDFWGFYNGVSNTTRVPSFNRFARVLASSFLGYERFFKGTGANRKSDINYGKYGILTKVTYPTGGSTEFVYEGNSTTLKRPDYTPKYHPNGDFWLSGVSNSKDYNFRYQYLKLANDLTYSFHDYGVTLASCTTISNSVNSYAEIFDIVDTTFCDGQTYNIQVSATLSCATGCSNGVYPSGDAVWIENTATGQVYSIFKYEDYIDANNWSATPVQTLTLPVGNYRFMFASKTLSSPLVVLTATVSALVYENNEVPAQTPAVVYDEFEVGGARISKIISKDTDGSVLGTKTYSYDEIIADGSSSSSGKLMDDLVFTSKGYGNFEYTPEGYPDNYKPGTGGIPGIGNNAFLVLSDNRIRSNPSAAGSHIGYSEVTEKQEDNLGNNLGQGISKYTNLQNDYLTRNILTTAHIWGGNCDFCHETYDCLDYKGGLDYLEMEELCGTVEALSYGEVYLLNAPAISYEHLNGSTKEDIVKDATGSTLRTTLNNYMEYSSGFLPYTYYPIMTRVGNQFLIAFPYRRILNTDLKNNKYSRLLSSTTTNYLSSGNLTTSNNYFYESSGHHYLTKTVTTNSSGESIIAKAYYPEDVSGDPFMSDLIADNRLQTPVITEAYINKGGSDELLSKQTTIYSDLNNSNGIVLPDKVTTQKTDLGVVERVLYEEYDAEGNLRQYRKPDGSPVSLIWGYNKIYPIAKIENATYSQVASHVSNLQTLSNADDDDCLNGGGCSEDALRTALTTLRNDANLSDALIATYTYNPLIGITSVTDARGNTSYYIYDTENRLKYIKDRDGHILNKNEYNYVPQN